MLIIGHSASCKKWLYFWSINWKLQIKVLACFNKTEVVISLQNKTDSSIFILVILLLFIAGIFMSSADWHDAINWYCNFKKCCAQLTMFIRSFLLMYLIQHLFYFYINCHKNDSLRMGPKLTVSISEKPRGLMIYSIFLKRWWANVFHDNWDAVVVKYNLYL